MSVAWLKKLNESSSTDHKRKVLGHALTAAALGSTDAQIFLRLAVLCYDPFFPSFNQEIPETVGIVDAENPWEDFCRLVDWQTRTGKTTPRDVHMISTRFSSDEWNDFCCLVLRKDLRAGITGTIINQECKGTKYVVPTFGVQQATDSTGQPKKLNGNKRLECKLNGTRVIAIVRRGHCVLHSHSGQELRCSRIANAIMVHNQILGRNTGDFLDEGFVLDGVIVGIGFSEYTEQENRQLDIVYHIFDILPLNAFKEGHYNVPQHKRLNAIERAQGTLATETDCLRIMSGLVVNLDIAEGHDIMNRFARDAVAEGFKGIMIKTMEAPYICKRSDFWMKYNPATIVDLNIAGSKKRIASTLN